MPQEKLNLIMKDIKVLFCVDTKTNQEEHHPTLLNKERGGAI